ncbi:FkbM family methyltransferase [Fibrella sp. HMF5335]|uniref:FkbM family methyltransferase n=1 Tax=Fibrella rubiginis TaxID=2817060 RepID=A0A939GEA1_9BACT|nr:FkbM family methyltransferase [Fibrella rubiginis]MBO0934967.1 FkbM family methyltransferase [Fibrella rubiginis]
MKLLRSLVRWVGHQPALRHGIKHRLLTRYHNPDRANSESFLANFYGLRYEGNFNSYIDWCIYYQGAYSRQELRLLETVARRLPTSSVFIDVGANVGNHSLFASTVFGQVYSFEPVPWLVERINRQQQLNNIQNLHVFPYALGEHDARQEFYSSTVANQGMGTLIKDREANMKPIQVDVKRGDDFLPNLSLDRVDFIKIDVEGFERYVLNGLAQTIICFQPIVFFEWSESGSSTQPDLLDSPYFDQYNFFRFGEGQPRGLVFEEDNFNLLPVQILSPDYNYVAVPMAKRSLVEARIITA